MYEYKCPYPDDCWYCREILTTLMNQRNRWNRRYGINEICKIMSKKMSRVTALKHTKRLINSGYLIDENYESKDELMDFFRSLFYERGIKRKLKNEIKVIDKEEKEEILDIIHKIIYDEYENKGHIGKKAIRLNYLQFRYLEEKEEEELKIKVREELALLKKEDREAYKEIRESEIFDDSYF